ncbi:ras-related protein RabJ [Ptiloglossa arizonensis]|uniref:ras-related protein RabJ n=1 Tax=Ptiloglossa arizonensis TaxID=3350558 RepID=UPI003FA10956
MKMIQGKVVVLGSQDVGKTSMIIRYVGKVFNNSVNPTVGASFFTCKLNLINAKIILQVWDTAGQERFKSMAPMYYRNANAAMLVFDLTQYDTFVAIKGWVAELRRNVEETMVLAVIGNKSDLRKERQVDSEEGRLYATKIGASYHETSVLEDVGINNVFLNIGTSLLKLSSTKQETTSVKVYESDDSNCIDTEVYCTLPLEESHPNVSTAIGLYKRSYACC